MDCAAQINTGAKYDSRGIQEVGGAQWGGHQGGQRAVAGVPRFRHSARAKTQGDRVRRGARRRDEDRARPSVDETGRHAVLTFDARSDDLRREFQFRHEYLDGDALELRLPEPRADASILNGQTIPIEERPARSAGRRDLGERTALPDHASGRRGHRDRLHAQPAVRRGILLLRQRPAHDPGRNPPGRVPRGDRRRVRDFFKKTYDATDIRSGIVPRSSACGSSGARLRVADQDQARVDQHVAEGPDRAHLHRTSSCASSWTTTSTSTPRPPRRSRSKIVQTERERKELAGIKKLAKERASTAKLHNKKLRDCRVHYRHQAQAARGEHAVHHRGRLRQRFDHQVAATWRRRRVFA